MHNKSIDIFSIDCLLFNTVIISSFLKTNIDRQGALTTYYENDTLAETSLYMAFLNAPDTGCNDIFSASYKLQLYSEQAAFTK